MKKNKKISIYIFTTLAVIAILLGIIMIIWGNKMSSTNKGKKSYYVLTDATVVDYDSEETYDSDSGMTHTVYGIIAEYEVNGKFYKIYPNSYSRSKIILPKIGSVVQIRYNPNSPADAIWGNNETSFVLLIFGSMFTLVGVFFIIVSILQRNIKSDMLNKKIGDRIAGIIMLLTIGLLVVLVKIILF